jgi:hypothetical protein
LLSRAHGVHIKTPRGVFNLELFPERCKKYIAEFQEAGYFLYGTGSEIEFHAASRWHVFNFHSARGGVQP